MDKVIYEIKLKNDYYNEVDRIMSNYIYQDGFIEAEQLLKMKTEIKNIEIQEYIEIKEPEKENPLD